MIKISWCIFQWLGRSLMKTSFIESLQWIFRNKHWVLFKFTFSRKRFCSIPALRLHPADTNIIQLSLSILLASYFLGRLPVTGSENVISSHIDVYIKFAVLAKTYNSWEREKLSYLIFCNSSKFWKVCNFSNTNLHKILTTDA